jgi:hypothetical protein
LAEIAGASPSTIFAAGFAPVGSASQRVTFGSEGSDVGSGCRLPLAGQLASWSPPRTKISVEPSSEKVSWVNSWPSSALNCVTCRGT